MTLYIRGYSDYSYEIIYLEGIFRKSRIHILVNPGKSVKLPGQASADDTEINIESLTHILAMETSVPNPKLIERTTFIAERTNKPIITNQETADKFKAHGLSVRQLRILGFQEEVVEGIHVDPVYLDELSEEVQPSAIDRDTGVTGFFKKMNPVKWNPLKKIKKTILPGDEDEKTPKVDTTKPLAFHINLSSKQSLLLPLDSRGVDQIDRILPQHKVHSLVVPNKDVAFTKKVGKGLSNVVLLSAGIKDEEVLTIPSSHNPGIYHETIVGGLDRWIEIK